MQLDEYRSQLERFHEQINRERYLYLSGLKGTYELARIYGDHSDLFGREAIDELRRKYEETPPHFESQRKGIRKLIGFAIDNHLKMCVKELSEQIIGHEGRAEIQWDGQSFGFHQAEVALANEADAGRRRELYRLRARIVEETNDLRLERFEKLAEACGRLGYENYLRACGDAFDFDYAALAGRMNELLEQTESVYVDVLRRALPEEVGVKLEEAHKADVGYFMRSKRFDPYFPQGDAVKCYAATLAGLGIDVRRQANIQIDAQMRPRKIWRAFCAPIKIPEEIKLVPAAAGGQYDYAALLREGGRAQHFAWTSRALAVENKFCGDRALSELYAILFDNLVTDKVWLAEMLGLSSPEDFVSLQMLFKLHTLRRHAAELIYEVKVYGQGKLTSEDQCEYARLLTEATKFAHDSVDYLRDMEDGLYAGDQLRAWALEISLRDHLKTRFGQQWFKSRKAGSFLIELWETGQLYSLEELASQVGLARLDLDALIDEFDSLRSIKASNR